MNKVKSSHVRVDGKARYRFAHGKAPRGIGSWWFRAGDEVFKHFGTFSEAQEVAKKHAASKGLFSVTVLS